MPNSAQFSPRVSTWSRATGSVIPAARRVVGTLWSGTARLASGRQRLAPGQAQPLEGLGGGHLMDQLAVDVEERRAVLVADDMLIPEFVVEGCGAHGWPQA